MFNRVPVEVLSQIVDMLDVKSKRKLAMTSKQWHMLINSEKHYTAARVTTALIPKKVNLKEETIEKLQKEIVLAFGISSVEASVVMESELLLQNREIQNQIKNCIQTDIPAIIKLLNQPAASFKYNELKAYALMDKTVAETILSNPKLCNQLKEEDLIAIAKMDISLADRIFNSPALYTKFSAISLCSKSKSDPVFAKMILKHENLLTILSNKPTFFGTFIKQHAELANLLPTKFARLPSQRRHSLKP